MKTLKRSLILFTLSVLILVSGDPVPAQAQPLFGSHSPRCEQLFVLKATVPASPKMLSLIQQFEAGASTFQLADSMARTVKNQSVADQKSWLKAMGQAYRHVPKKHADPMRWTKVSPRRLIDRAFMIVRGLHLDFQDGAKQNIPAVETYSRFLKEQNPRFEGNYGMAEIMPVLQFVKSELSALNSKSTTKSAVPFEVFLGGSFVNGKAKLETSDVDFTMDPSLIEISNSWSEKVNQLLKKVRPESNLTAEIHSIGPEFYGILNPIVIRVTAEQIELWVYPPANADQSRALLLPQTPTRYSIDP